MMSTYLPRTADALLRDYLDTFGAVLIEGPKWCGKTTTAKQQAGSVLQMQDPDSRDAYLHTAEIQPSLLLDGAVPRLIDEWQIAPKLWDAVRTQVDNRGETGQFILTGSNSVDERQIMHTGTGRIARLRMLPMSLYESRESSGTVSLSGLMDAPEQYKIDGRTSSMTIPDLIFAACRGGWPAALLGKRPELQLLTARMYVESLCSMDIRSVDGVQRDEKLARGILRAYARNISTLAKKSKILQDVQLYHGSCSDKTLDSYLTALERLFVVQDVEAWSPAVRSAKTMSRGMKRELADPSIAVAALGLTPEALQTDLKTFGFIFETMCIRDLRAYTLARDGRIAYYHDRYDLEADIVLHLGDGRYALIECKLGSREIDEGAAHLLEIRQLIREYNTRERQLVFREPDALIVLTGGPMAYRREDGVCVVPLGSLRP